MIERYNVPEITDLWADHNKFTQYLNVELALIKALENHDRVKKGTADSIRSKVQIRPERVQEIEAQVHHDVIAFCTSITEQLDTELARFFHFGATSSDIIDTATNLQIKQSLEAILPIYRGYLKALLERAEKHKDLLSMGRSHGIFAEPIMFGQKFLSFFSEAARSYVELKNIHADLTGQLSGAVGSYTVLDHEIEKDAIESLGLKVEPVSSQVLPRDIWAKMVSTIAIAATSMERLAVELRHLQHSDLNELAEGFSKLQKGSSTMPHKKNPISSENITGMARVLRSYVSIALDNIPLWHERDIAHSSAERIYLQDCLGYFYYALKRMTGVVQNLVVNEEVIEGKVKENSVYLSSYYLHELLEKTDQRREDLYRLVQEASFKAYEDKTNLKDELEKAGGFSLSSMEFDQLKTHYGARYNQTMERVKMKYNQIWD